MIMIFDRVLLNVFFFSLIDFPSFLFKNIGGGKNKTNVQQNIVFQILQKITRLVGVKRIQMSAIITTNNVGISKPATIIQSSSCTLKCQIIGHRGGASGRPPRDKRLNEFTQFFIIIELVSNLKKWNSELIDLIRWCVMRVTFPISGSLDNLCGVISRVDNKWTIQKSKRFCIL